MKHRQKFLTGIVIMLAAASVLGQEAAPTRTRRIISRPPPVPTSPISTPASARKPTQNATLKVEQPLYDFSFQDTPLEIVLQEYSRLTGRIILNTGQFNANITLSTGKIRLTKKESLEALDAILAMHNIVIIPKDEKFLRVVQSTATDLTGQGIPISMNDDKELPPSDKMVTQLIQLNNVEIPEVQNAIQHLMHAYGKILTLERSNSLMITDTEANIIRIKELIKFLDMASARIEPKIYELQYAEAADIAAKLNEIVEMAQADNKQPTTPNARTSNNAPSTPPGVIRARSRRGSSITAPTQATIATTESGDTAIIQGEVKIMSDERTNLIIIFSQTENFDFFEKIIKVLDVEVEPAISFEVINLEYADADEVSGTLNELVGAAQDSSSVDTPIANREGVIRPSKNTNNQIARRQRESESSSATENLNKLSENTKILADKRTNAILLMGRKSDIAALKNVVKSLDVMLEQVKIEAAIFEVGLTDSLRHGIDWIYAKANKVAGWNAADTNILPNVAGGALSYWQNLTGINTAMAIQLASGDSDAKLLATPVIITTDNTEASLSIGEQRPVVTSTSSFANSSGTRSSNYEYKDIGIQLTITPRINPQRDVIMELTQQADQLGGTVSIDNNEVPVILNREFQAIVTVPDQGTIVLGGMIQTDTSDSLSKIPILGDIPFLGRYLFSSSSKTETQRELLVLMTPTVLKTKEELLEESRRLYRATSLRQKDWPDRHWSNNKLQDIKDPEQNGEDALNPDDYYYPN